MAKKKPGKTSAPKRPKPPQPNPEPPKGRPGRPFVIDPATAAVTLAGLGGIHATLAECAAVLKVDGNTLRDAMERWPELRTAYEAGKDLGKASLRRAQFKLAEKNPTMAIFLGLNYLGQRDLRHVAGSVEHNHTHTVMGALLKEIDGVSRDIVPVIEHQPSEESIV